VTNGGILSGSHGGRAGELLKGRYRVGEVLGEGAMGIVYRGTDEHTQTPVAIKTLQPSAFHSPKAHERFQREAELANKLHHPGIAEILDFGTEGETPFLVMELVEGVELSEVIEKESPLPPARALDLIIQLCEALAEAHRHNLIHRDIKPANLRLVDYAPGGPCRLKVLDFGIAKEMGDERGQLTTTGAIMGTPLYLAPELLSEVRAELDGRIDQYSVGVVLYQLLAGCPPFAGQTVAAILLSHVTTPPPPPPSTVPDRLQHVVLRMLKKTAQERYPTDDALLHALKECIPVCRSAHSAPRGATRPSSASLAMSLPREQPARFHWLYGLAIGVLFFASAAIFATIQLRRTAVQESSVPPSMPVMKAYSATEHANNKEKVSTRTISTTETVLQSPPLPSKEVGSVKTKPKNKAKSSPRNAQKEDPFAVPLAR